MKLFKSFLIITFFSFNSYAQPIRVAILDFENISGIAKYDGLGKAMSSMLISDIESSVSSKKIQLVERAQIQKLLKEQNFQSSGSVNKNTIVKTGKILGVNYLLVGDVYILNDQLIINARLTNTETGDIVFSKKQEGKLVNWLLLKSNISVQLANNLKLPINNQNKEDNITISEKSLLLYANGINYLDKEEIDSANIVLTELKYSNRNFKYTQNELNILYDKAQKQNENVLLRQKAYILNLHKRIPENPKDAWDMIENFWNGPLDEKYPYLEYVFLKNTFELFKNDSIWLSYKINRHGVSTSLGDMLLYSISSHAAAAAEIDNAIYYNELRRKKYPFSEIEMIWGLAIAEDDMLLGLVSNPNVDSVYYLFLAKAQIAWIRGIGSNNKNQMLNQLNELMPLLDLEYHNYYFANIYLQFHGSPTFLFNPYDVLAKLVVLVGSKDEKKKLRMFYEKNSNEMLYNKKLIDLPEYNDKIENDLLMKNAAIFCNCRVEDIIDKKHIDYEDNIQRNLSIISWYFLALMVENKFSEASDLLQNIGEENIFKLREYKAFGEVTFDVFYYISSFICSVNLGRMDDVKKYNRQCTIRGIDVNPYLNLHTEFLE
jgi:TolB-like protein